MTGPQVIGIPVAPDPQQDAFAVPSAAELAIDPAELSNAALTPRCIVRDYLYADVAAIVAPGGTGKTTILLHEAIGIALGRRVWGLKVENPGRTLIVTAEDQRERLVARIREILQHVIVTPAEHAHVLGSILIWDVSGEGLTLTYAVDGNIVLTRLADNIVEAFEDDPPVLVVFDPMVSFGTSEERVNTNEQQLILAARRIVRGLDCCVRYVHHTGKANARDKALDQYAGRGGSALADGSRMTAVLQPWRHGDDLRPPAGCTPKDSKTSITILARPKLSYSRPNLPLIWIKRTGHAFDYCVEFHQTPAQKQQARADQVQRFLESEFKAGRHWTKTQLDDAHGRLGMTRAQLREALTDLSVAGRVVNEPLPQALRQGARKEFICPADLSAGFGGVDENETGGDD